MSLAQIPDVEKAVAAAKEAFEEGEWGKMNPRDRGKLLYKYMINCILYLNTASYTWVSLPKTLIKIYPI